MLMRLLHIVLSGYCSFPKTSSNGGQILKVSFECLIGFRILTDSHVVYVSDSLRLLSYD
jgi:hypothetical protein